MPDSLRRKVSDRVRHPAVQEMFLQLRHPVIWGLYVPLFALAFIAIPLDLIGFEQGVTWTCVAILIATLAWSAMYALVMACPGLGPWHHIFTRIASFPLRPSPGLISLMAAPFSVSFIISLSLILINNANSSGTSQYLNFLKQANMEVIMWSAMILLGIFALIGFRRVRFYRRSGRTFCPGCGNDLEHAPRHQCAECGRIPYW